MVRSQRRVPVLVTGLLVAAVALAALDATLGRPVRGVPIAALLAVMGAGIGLVVAPMVEMVLGRLPPERSGMAAAAVTAAREIGGVVGVTVLGAVLYAQLFSGLTRRLVDLGIPSATGRSSSTRSARAPPIPTTATPTPAAACCPTSCPGCSPRSSRRWSTGPSTREGGVRRRGAGGPADRRRRPAGGRRGRGLAPPYGRDDHGVIGATRRRVERTTP